MRDNSGPAFFGITDFSGDRPVTSYMTKREFLAGMAMQGFVADEAVHGTPEEIAISAVLYADALLAELAK